MSAEPEREWTVKRAVELAAGDHIPGDMLPLGVPGEVIFVRQYERHRSCWAFVAFEQRDGFHDSTTFLADAKVRVRIADERRVEDPTGLNYSRADDEPDGDATQQLGHRIEPHVGAVTDEGLVEEKAIAAHYDATVPGDMSESCACGESFTSPMALDRHVELANDKSDAE